MKSKINEGAIITEPGSSVRNKTGGWRMMRPVIDKSKCIGCGKCWTFCPAYNCCSFLYYKPI